MRALIHLAPRRGAEPALSERLTDEAARLRAEAPAGVRVNSMWRLEEDPFSTGGPLAGTLELREVGDPAALHDPLSGLAERLGECIHPDLSTALVGSVTVLVPLGAVIDKHVELGRLRKEYDQMDRDFQRTRGKLDNPNFVHKAPREVVDKERARLEDLTRSLDKLRDRIDKVNRLPD